MATKTRGKTAKANFRVRTAHCSVRPQLYLLICRERLVLFEDGLLNCDRTLQCAVRTRKFDHAGMTHTAELSTGVFIDQTLENIPLNVKDLERLQLIRCHEPAVIDDVRGQQRSYLSSDLRHMVPCSRRGRRACEQNIENSGFYRAGVAGREPKRPQNLAAMPDVGARDRASAVRKAV